MSDSTPPFSSSTLRFHRPVEVFVVRERQRPRYWLHLLLLFMTLLSTLIVGARLEHNFTNNLPIISLTDDFLFLEFYWIWEAPSRLLLGLPFAGTLLIILLAHEMGHYLYCKRYAVDATLPFFIPAPTLIGTLGAFIRVKSPIRSRTALFDIGIAGPIAGFVLAALALMVSLALSRPLPAGLSPSDLEVGYPLIFDVAQHILAMLGIGAIGLMPLHSVQMHPMAIAAWVGMFATALNLLPGGQLDGGHIVFSLFPRSHKWVSRITILLLLPMGIFLWEGWIVWAVLLGITGMRHPQVPPWPGLNTPRKWLAAFALLMLILTFVPIPFSGFALGWPFS